MSTFGEGQSTPALKRPAELPGGCYRVGFRPNYLDWAAYSGCD
jgi:hypothetical protein